MTKQKFLQSVVACVCLVLLVHAPVRSQDLKGVKCIVEGDAQADANASAEYRDGKVYFCCEDCVAKFKAKMADPNSDLNTKANHQLVVTGQFEQAVCPLTGKAINPEMTAEIAGAKVSFCCSSCLSTIQSQPDVAVKAEKVFASAAFEKGFVKKKQEPKLDGLKCFIMPKKDVKADVFVEYGDHKVYFCCKSCVSRFKKSPENYTAQANQHLVVTEQVKQTACPISGAAVKEDQFTEVNGTKVYFCCGNCKGKVDSAADAEKANLVFGKEAFEKAFK